MDINESTASTDVTKKGVYLRGLFVQRYSGIEFGMTHLLAAASLHPAYGQLGPLPYSSKGKLKRFEELLNLDGPVNTHAGILRAIHEQFKEIEDYRHFIVHGMMLGFADPNERVDFRLYSHIEGEAHWGNLTFTIDEFALLTERMQPLSSEFTKIVADLSRKLNFESEIPDWVE